MPGFAIEVDDKCGGPLGQLSGPSHVVEYARTHRFILKVGVPGGQDINVHVKKITKPKFEYEPGIIHHGPEEITRPGKLKCDPVEITFYEVINSKDNNETATVTKLLTDWHYSDKVHSVAKPSGLKHSPRNYLKDMQISMIDGMGNEVWSYFLYSAWPHKITPSDFDYTSNEISEITITLKYTRAIQKSA